MTRVAALSRMLRLLPKNKRREINGMMKLYKRIDRDMARLRRKTGLMCVPYCGECCKKACVAASALELQPLAVHILQAGTHDHWLRKIDPDDARAPCVFYSPYTLANGGHCHAYEFRPLLCRLFGFSARYNKYQKRELMLCREIKEHDYQGAAKAQDSPSAAVYAPVSTHYLIQAGALSSGGALQCVNINQAFVQALDAIGLCCDMVIESKKNMGRRAPPLLHPLVKVVGA